KPYVFNSALLKIIKNVKEDSIYFDQNTQYIEHGTTHILRVPIGKLAKIWIGQEAKILKGQNEPYIFHEPQFELVRDKENEFLFDQSNPYINHGTTHILRVPTGKFAKIWLGQKARILQAQDEPYIFHDPQFKLEMKDKKTFLFDQSDLHIHHG